LNENETAIELRLSSNSLLIKQRFENYLNDDLNDNAGGGQTLYLSPRLY